MLSKASVIWAFWAASNADIFPSEGCWVSLILLTNQTRLIIYAWLVSFVAFLFVVISWWLIHYRRSISELILSVMLLPAWCPNIAYFSLFVSVKASEITVPHSNNPPFILTFWKRGTGHPDQMPFINNSFFSTFTGGDIYALTDYCKDTLCFSNCSKWQTCDP